LFTLPIWCKDNWGRGIANILKRNLKPLSQVLVKLSLIYTETKVALHLKTISPLKTTCIMVNPRKEKFFSDVYEVVKQIPNGRVTSYGAIAAFLGTKGSSRMVGYAMNASHGTGVPAHRVVNRLGLLTGKHHFPTPNAMEELLAAEGVVVEENQVKNFDKLFWDPMVELGI
jgi:methylated-DNA-protein-cysteine methyltransferase-like protein